MARRTVLSRICFVVISLTLVAAAVAPAPAAAQARVTPADSAAILLRTATVFEERGDWSVAEALYQHILERYDATPAAVTARERLGASRELSVDRSGRVELQVWSTMYGLWLGIAVPAAFGADGSEPYGVGLLTGGPAGLVVARAVTKTRSLSVGQTRAITWGGTWGTWQGLGWAMVFDIGEEAIICGPFGCDGTTGADEERFAASIVGGLAGIAIGGVLARDPIEWGVATAANHGSLWGSWFGAAANVLFDIDDDAGIASALLFGNAGLAGGALLASRYDLSRNRVRLISLGGLLGGLGGAGLDLIIQPDDDKAAIMVPLVGSVAGLAVAAHATRDYDRLPAGGDGRAGGALLGYRDGRWSLDAPLPLPTLVPVDDVNGRTTWRPAVGVELLRATFR